MSSRTTIKQVGFVVQPLEHDTQTRAPLAPLIPRYEPLYNLSYGLPGTPASQGHWWHRDGGSPQITSGDAFTFSLYGICRSAKRPLSPGPTQDGARKANRRVTIDPMDRELTRPEDTEAVDVPCGTKRTDCGRTYTFEDSDIKVLGIVEIAQLPHNIDPMTKIKAWSRLDFDLKFGEVLTEQWKITCKDLPVGATPGVKHFAKSTRLST
ncbi:hypothetical protein FA13DRAFT_1837225 [Coprinellus micaceus]|uniref:Uncharacterized protein n=1 Tax=Coprinellus micaceus TaxID=71717 RepID=A0A4Y7SFA4_COPMI|nr:hypothetical protein FA13DRAFT_1837225 [Coprinellus micaceus]